MDENRAGGATLRDAEEWPIAVGAHALNPRLLLSLACARMALAQGHQAFTRFALAPKSCWLFVYLFWFCHCKAFQPRSEDEQEHLLRRAAAIYVQLLASKELGANQDFFFKHYPYAVGHAIAAGFYYLCPGSRHLYTPTFKRIVYLQCAQVLGGLGGVSPSSVLVARALVYPEEAAEDAAAEAKAAAEARLSAAAALDLAREAAEARGGGAAGGGGGVRGGEASAPARSLKVLGDTQAARRRARLVGPARPGELSDELPPLPGHALAGGGRGGGHAKPPAAHAARSNKAARGASGLDGGASVASLDRTTMSAASDFDASVETGGGPGSDFDDEGGLVAARRPKGPASTSAASPARGGGGGAASRPSSAGGAPLGEEYWQKRRAQSLAPLQALTGARHALRFRPDVPVGVLQRPLPRQAVGKFDAAGISPLLQQYLEHPLPHIKAGRKPELVARTAPVRWCRTGGVETSRPVAAAAGLGHRLLLVAADKAARQARAADDAASRQHLRRDLALLEKQRLAVLSGGAVSKGRYSLELVLEINARHSEGARRRLEKLAKADKAREDEEKERQTAAVEAQRKAAGITDKSPKAANKAR
jgi:hypothetical protein